MDLKELIKRMTKEEISITKIANVLQLSEEDVKKIVTANVKKPSHAHINKRPSAMPDAFYITRFKQGHTVKEIAEELGCNLSGLYRLLAKRGISPYTYYPPKEDSHEQETTDQA